MDGKFHFIPTSFTICNAHFFKKIKKIYLVVVILLAQDEERWGLKNKFTSSYILLAQDEKRWDGQVTQEGDTL